MEGHESERRHFGSVYYVRLRHLKAKYGPAGHGSPPYFSLGHAEVYLHRHVLHAEPQVRLTLSRGGGDVRVKVNLQIDEAEALRDALDKLISEARS